MRQLRILLALVALVLCNTVNARPAYPGILKATQTDGTVLSYRILGDEHCHSFATLDGYLIERNGKGDFCYQTMTDNGPVLSNVMAHDAADRLAAERMHVATMATKDFSMVVEKTTAMRKSPKKAPLTDFPTIGNVRGLLLLVDFSDVKFQPQYDRALYERQMNEVGYSEYGATGSARDYFIAQSMGKFTPQIDVVGPVHLSQPEAYYGGNSMGHDGRPDQMVVDACNGAKSQYGVDFSDYDFDNDGNVDFVFILYAGYGENYGAPSTTIWPHMSHLSSLGNSCQLDGKRIDLYACSCELNGASGTEIDGIGAFCHEFGHVLGLPDIYNTANPSYTELGSWDVMDASSYNNNSRTPSSYTAFERYSVGWMDFIELEDPQDCVVVPEITENNVAYRLQTANKNEFFTIENHQQVGWDKYQGGKGLMIIHVLYDAGFWNGNAVNSGLIPHYDLEEADGTQGIAQKTDLFPIPGNNMFTDYSKPDALCWDGTPNDKGISEITQNEDGTISFKFMRDRLPRPVVSEVTDVTTTSFTANWQPVDDAIGYSLHVSEVLTKDINPIVLEEDFSSMTEGEYPAAGYENIAQYLNDYMNTLGWTGTDLYEAGGYVRIGSYGVSGRITSPVVEIPTGKMTLGLHTVGYPGKSVNYNIVIKNAITGEEIHNSALKANRTEMGITIPLEDCPQSIIVDITTRNERLYINDLRIINEVVDSATVWSLGPEEWTFEPITDTSYRVENLIPGRSYVYTVRALDVEPMRGSAPSDEDYVTLLPSDDSGIREMRERREENNANHYYNLQGVRVNNNFKGIVIENGRKIIRK